MYRFECTECGKRFDTLKDARAHVLTEKKKKKKDLLDRLIKVV